MEALADKESLVDKGWDFVLTFVWVQTCMFNI